MPVNDPRVGELWEMRDPEGRAIRGVVADVSSTAVTMVSLTGNRSRISPQSMRLSWAYASPPPRAAYNCSRRSCDSRAIFRYYRGQSPEYACPRHMPVGVRAEILPDQPDAPTLPVPRVESPPPCPECRNTEPFEILPETGASPLDMLPSEVTEWSCPLCSARWILVTPRLDVNYPSSWHMIILTAARNRASRRGHEVVRVTVAPTAVVTLFSEGSPENERLTLWGVAVFPDENLPPRSSRLHLRTIRQRPRERVPAPNDAVLQALRDNNAQEQDSDEESQERPDGLAERIPEGSRWVHKGRGQVVEVMKVENAAVTFRSEEQSFRMIYTDFLHFHRPFVMEGHTPPPSLPLPDLAPGEEWTSVEGTVTILSVDSKRDLVSVRWAHGSQRTSKRGLQDFATDKWRKIVRKTAFQRLLDEDD